MGKDLEIDLKIGDADARRVVDRQVIGLSNLQMEAVKYADKLEAAKRAANASAAAAQKSLKAAQDAADRAAAAQEKAEARALDAAVKAAERKSRESQRAAQAAIAAADRKARAEVMAAQKGVDAEASRVAKLDRLGRQQLSGEEVWLRARARANQEYQQRRVDSAARIMAGESEAASASDRLVESAGRIAAGFVGLGAAESVLREIAGAISDSRQKSVDFAESLLKTKEQLAEIATLRGLAFADDDFVRKMAGFSQATGLSIGESDQFQRQLYGSAAGALQKGNVDEATLEKASVLTGQVAARQTKDFGTRGDLVGMLGQFRKYDKGDAGAEQIASDAEAVRLGLTEGRGDDAPLTRAFLSVAGSMIGEGRALPAAPELAALIGIMSLTSGPMMADTAAEQLMRGLRGDTPKQMEFVKSFAGIDEHDKLPERLNKMIPALRAKQGEGRDIQTFLTESGMNQEQSRRLTEMVPNLEMFNTRLAKSQNPVDGRAIADANRDFNNSPLGTLRSGAAARFNAQLEKGKEREALEAEMPAAEADLIKEGLDTNPAFAAENLLRAAQSGFTTSGRDLRIQQRALDRLGRRAGGGYSPAEVAAGADLDPAYGAPGGMTAVGAAAGFDAYGAAAQFYKDMIQINQAQLKELQKQNAGKPGNGAPPVFPAAPAPAGRRP